jgi:hypothetical protein
MPRIGPSKDDTPGGIGLTMGLLVRLLGILILTVAAALVAEQRRPRLSALQAPRSRRTMSLLPRPVLTFDAEPVAPDSGPVETHSGPVGTHSGPLAAESVLAAPFSDAVASRAEQSAAVRDETEVYPDPWSVVADLVTDDDEEPAGSSPAERLRGRWDDWVYTTPMSQIIWTAVAIGGTLIVITVGIVVVSQR